MLNGPEYFEVLELLKQGLGLGQEVEQEREEEQVDFWSLIDAINNNNATKVTQLLASKRIDPSAFDNLALDKTSELGFLDILKILLTDKRVDPASYDNNALRVAIANNHHMAAISLYPVSKYCKIPLPLFIENTRFDLLNAIIQFLNDPIVFILIEFSKPDMQIESVNAECNEKLAEEICSNSLLKLRFKKKLIAFFEEGHPSDRKCIQDAVVKIIKDVIDESNQLTVNPIANDIKFISKKSSHPRVHKSNRVYDFPNREQYLSIGRGQPINSNFKRSQNNSLCDNQTGHIGSAYKNHTNQTPAKKQQTEESMQVEKKVYSNK